MKPSNPASLEQIFALARSHAERTRASLAGHRETPDLHDGQRLARELAALAAETAELPGPVALDEVARAVLADLQGALAAAGVRIECEPLPVVFGEAGSLRRLVGRLVACAVAHRREAAPRLRLSARSCGGGWTLRVVGDGLALPPAVCARALERAPCAPGRSAPPPDGEQATSCRQLAERYGGTLELDGERGFAVRLPAPPRERGPSPAGPPAGGAGDA